MGFKISKRLAGLGLLDSMATEAGIFDSMIMYRVLEAISMPFLAEILMVLFIIFGGMMAFGGLKQVKNLAK